jgi:small subunit ribosomal protein S20
MANTKSAEKRMRQSEKRRARNRAARAAMRTAVKKVRGAIDAGDAGQAETALKEAVAVIDRSVTKNVVHRNTASRTKSRLSSAVRKAAAAAAK